jgi:hypothetical protein
MSQEQYGDNLRQTQEAWVGAVESWTKSVREAFTQTPASPFGVVDPSVAIDQFFDFAQKTLDAQRQVAKSIASASLSVGQALRQQGESAAEAVRQQGESAAEAVRQQADASRRQAESTREAAREQAAAKYGDLTKADLQEELEQRDLPKSGNVEELRQRLVDDDLK